MHTDEDWASEEDNQVEDANSEIIEIKGPN